MFYIVVKLMQRFLNSERVKNVVTLTHSLTHTTFRKVTNTVLVVRSLPPVLVMWFLPYG